ncbi:hypothetical protein HWV62_14456 [Athelia sp. TMB]|nr:hypothetical protein HWV62_14456 [Athelia sp. TMB]
MAMSLDIQKIAAADYPVKSVTIFKSAKAEVNRTFSVKLKAGQNKIQISRLSSAIDTESVRISGLDEARLFDVVCTVDKKQDNDLSADHPSEVIRLLNTKKRAFESQKRVLEHQADLLVSYAKTLTCEHVNPLAMHEFLQDFETRGNENLEAVSQIDEKIVQINRQIAQETAKVALKTGEANAQVTVVVVSTADMNVDMKLTYSEDWINAALTLSTVSSDMVARSVPHLHTARIRQAQFAGLFKGQAPNRNAGGAGLFGNQQQQQPTNVFGQTATLQPQQQVGALFGAPQQSQQQQQFQQQGGGIFGAPQQNPSSSGLFGVPHLAASTGFGAFGAASASQPATDAFPAATDYTEEEGFEEISAPTAEPTTTVTESPLSISYAVEGQSTIPSDGVAHQVPVAKLDFESKCEVKNTSEFRLLPGSVSVFLDDGYVSKTSIHDVNPTDTFDCTLGTDPSTFISYTRTHKTVRNDTGTFAEASSTTTYTNVTTIHNKHRFPLPEITVRDTIPLTDDKRFKVHLKKPDGLADAGDEVVDLKEVLPGLKVRWSGKGGEKEGRFEFSVAVEAGKKVKVESGWEVKAPSDLKWHEATNWFRP